MVQRLLNGFNIGIVTGSVILLLIFAISWHREKRRLSNGIWFNLFLISFVLDLALLVVVLDYQPLTAVAVVAFILVLVAVGLLFFSLVFLLLWNARIVWKRESHTLANSLTLLLGIGILVLWIINLLPTQRFLPQWLNQLLVVVPMIFFYLLASFYNYLTNLVLYQFNRPGYQQDYIIVLGAGLLQGNRVSPLLGQRIMRAIHYYQKQLIKTGHRAKLIFSGGQGGDETVPEGMAMQKYAIDQGLPAKDALAETMSKTTYENMQFSRVLIEKDSGKPVQDSRMIFATNNYHTFRAGLFAKMAGLPANGIGSKTSKYFLPNAVIREYLAIFMMKKKQHMLIIGGILVLDVAGVLWNLLAKLWS